MWAKDPSKLPTPRPIRHPGRPEPRDESREQIVASSPADVRRFFDEYRKEVK